jgi:imidazolonepropionase-like amidohydrolase
VTERIALAATRLLDGAGRVLEDAALVVEGTRIAAVGRRSELEPLLRETHVEEFGDSTLLPGLVDAHVHVTFPADDRSYVEMLRESDEYLALVGLENAERHFAGGVTTMRDNGARGGATFAVRHFLETRAAPGPRLLVAGRPVTPTGGHLHWCNGTADGPEGVRRAVRERAKEGVDHVKLVASGGGTRGTRPFGVAYAEEELSAAVETAHDLGLLTAAHVHASAGIARAVAAGVDCLEHVSFLVERGGARVRQFGAAWSGLVADYDGALAERIAASGCYVSATLLGGYGAVRELRAKSDELTDDERSRLAAAEEHVQRKLGIFASLARDGLLPRLVVSTDAGSGDTRFGQLHLALELAVEAGLTPAQAVEAATRVAAEACGLAEAIGTLEPAKEADVLVVAGDASRDVGALAQVAAVYKGGVRAR